MTTPSFEVVGKFLEHELMEKGHDAVMFNSDLIIQFPELPPFTGNWKSHPLCWIFDELDREDAALDRPLRTAIVVSKEKRIPGGGFFEAYEQYLNPGAQIRNEMAKLEIHQGQLKALVSHWNTQ